MFIEKPYLLLKKRKEYIFAGLNGASRGICFWILNMLFVSELRNINDYGEILLLGIILIMFVSPIFTCINVWKIYILNIYEGVENRFLIDSVTCLFVLLLFRFSWVGDFGGGILGFCGELTPGDGLMIFLYSLYFCGSAFVLKGILLSVYIIREYIL